MVDLILSRFLNSLSVAYQNFMLSRVTELTTCMVARHCNDIRYYELICNPIQFQFDLSKLSYPGHSLQISSQPAHPSSWISPVLKTALLRSP